MFLEKNRTCEIDGLRGWASVAVILFHFFQETFGKLFPIFHSPVFGFILNGHLMVLIFFVLSGDALSASFFNSKDLKSTARVAISRYFRLTFIVAISCGLSYVLMSLGFTWNIVAASVVHREDWLGIFLNFTPQLDKAIEYIFQGVYFHHGVYTSYNPFLWTMAIELLGSILVFVNILILSQVHERLQVRILLVEFLYFMLFGEYMSLFVFGMLLGKLRTVGVFKSIMNSRWNIACFIGFFGVSFVLMPFYQKNIFAIADLLSFHLFQHRSYMFLWACSVVFLVYASRHLVWFFGNDLSRFFGKISFPLYVMQFNVLVSITSLGIIWARTNGLLTSPYVLLIPLGSVFVTILVSVFVEAVERRFLNKMRDFVNQRIIDGNLPNQS